MRGGGARWSELRTCLRRSGLPDAGRRAPDWICIRRGRKTASMRHYYTKHDAAGTRSAGDSTALGRDKKRLERRKRPTWEGERDQRGGRTTRKADQRGKPTNAESRPTRKADQRGKPTN